MKGLSIGDDPAFRALFDAMPCACMIHRMVLDERGHAVDYIPLEANPCFSRSLEFDPSAIVGKRASEYLPESEVRHWVSVFAPTALEGLTTSVSVYSPRNRETYRVTAIGPERDFFIVMFSIAGDEGHPGIHAQAARWTDGRASARDAVRLMFMTMPCAAAIHKVDRDERGKPIDYTVADVNGAFCALLGTTPGEMIGMSASDRLRSDELAYWLDAFASVAFGKKPASGVRLVFRNRSDFEGIAISPESGYVMVVFIKKGSANLAAT